MLARLSRINLAQEVQTKHLGIVDGNVKFINDTREKLPDPVDYGSVLSSL